jgi:predicted nucleic acid-binding protein
VAVAARRQAQLLTNDKQQARIAGIFGVTVR